jgi:hypothetical protein
MKSPRTALAATIILALGAGLAAGEPPDAGGEDVHRLFTEGNRLFSAAKSPEDLQGAVENFRAIIGRGIRNGRLYYNLGCAHLRLQEIGPAIANLRRALLFIPDDARAAATLEYARQQVRDEFPRSGEGSALRTVFAWHYGIPFGLRLWTALLAGAIFWALLAARSFVALPFHRTALAGLLVVAAACGASAAVEGFLRGGREAVIVAPEAEVRAGNGEHFDRLFSKPVRSGVEVRIVEAREGWLQVEFPNEARGWVRASAVEAIAPAGGR